MKFARIVFAIAGIYGFIALAPMYFMEARIGVDAPPAITHPEFFYGFIGVALAWQVLFLLIAHDPVRYRLAIIPGILEKLGFGIAAMVLFAQGRLAGQPLAGGVVDLIFVALFSAAFFMTRRREPPSAA